MRISLFVIALLLVQVAASTPPAEEGKTIFTARCASCHNINKTLTGPALAKLDERRSMDWIIGFIKSSQAMIKSGDKDAVEVYEKFNKIPMPDHPDLTDENIKSLVEYIKSESANSASAAPFATPSKLRPAYLPLTLSNYGFYIGFMCLVFLLIMGMLLAVHVKAYERSLNKK